MSLLAAVVRSGARRARAIALVALACAMTCCALALASCAHEPEIARPLPESEKPNAQAQDASESDKEAQAQAEAQAAEAQEKAQQEAEAQKKHEGPFAVAIRNAGGVDGLATATQQKLEAAGLAADTHTYALGSYIHGTLPATIVYVTGEGEDAEEVRAEADAIVKALGCGSVATYDAATAGEPMDGIDILVIVGQDA